MPKSLTTKELIRERDLLKERLDKMDCRIQNRKSRVITKHLRSAILSCVESSDDVSGQADFISKTLGNGDSTSVDNIAINNSGFEYKDISYILNLMVDSDYLEKTVWAYDDKGGYKQVKLDSFNKMLSDVKLGNEYPHNMATGNDIHVDNDSADLDPLENLSSWVHEYYQFIWIPTVKYKELLETAYNKFLEDTKDD